MKCVHCKGYKKYEKGSKCVECHGTGEMTPEQITTYRDRVAKEMAQLPINTKSRYRYY